MTNIENNFERIQDSLLNLLKTESFVTFIADERFFTAEIDSNMEDIVIKQYKDEDTYKELDGEVEDEDMDVLYIDSKDFFQKIYNNEGIFIENSIKGDIHKEFVDKIYYIKDFFGIS